MRLIDTSNYKLAVFSSAKTTPEYAILSHTWGADSDEVSFQEMTSAVESPPAKAKIGFEKIKEAARLAKTSGIKYLWVDTCCIDKTSSAELSEAINSMFKWYQEAKVCYVFLADWDAVNPSSANCRWWARGWTLQELVASQSVEFYDKNWQLRGTKATLRGDVSRISGIDEDVLSGHTALSQVPVAVRMSWAASRETTREEDQAYSLLGIFDVNMPMLYGEGPKAFQRLQEEIIKTTTDMSVFAWKADEKADQDYMGILAPSPREFAESKIYPTRYIVTESFMQVSLGRFVEVTLPEFIQDDDGDVFLPLFHYPLSPGQSPRTLDTVGRRDSFGVFLRRIDRGIYVRSEPKHLSTHHLTTVDLSTSTSIKICKSLSASESSACGRRLLWISCPSTLADPNYGLDHFDQGGSRTEKFAGKYGDYGSGSRFWSGERDNSVVRLYFKPEWHSQFYAFCVLCCFRNPRGQLMSPGYWACDLAPVQTLEDVPKKDERAFALSGRGDGPFSVTKTFEIPQRRRGAQTKKVEVTLRREATDTGKTGFSVFLNVLEPEPKGKQAEKSPARSSARLPPLSDSAVLGGELSSGSVPAEAEPSSGSSNRASTREGWFKRLLR